MDTDTNYPLEARRIVCDAFNAAVEKDVLTLDEVFVVWFSKTLQNWKALVATTRSGDGLYFEVTHNGDKSETYVDTYRKVDNVAVPD